MSITEAASESRRTIDATAAAAPKKAAAARAALNDALNDVGVRAKDLVAGVQSRARDQIDRRRSLTADRLESLAGALRPADQSPRARRMALAVAGGSGLALVAVLGAGVVIGLVLSRRMRKRAEQRAAAKAASRVQDRVQETTLLPQTVEQAPVAAGLSF